MNTVFRKLVLLFSLLTLFGAIKGQNVIYTEADSLIYDGYIKKFSQDKNKPFSELIIATARYFLGKPYVASTLEVAEKEALVVNLRELDCTTFVENCIALSGIIKSGDLSFKDFCNMLTYIRYREGRVEGYPSRLHYTSDWVYDNEKKGILKNISGETGGQDVRKTINFMSSHPQSYRHLKDKPENVEKMKEIENEINARDAYIIIPVSAIPSASKGIRNGDIIAFATSVAGLDYSHVGIACWENGKLHFIHASSTMKKVVAEKKTLLNYCRDSKGCTGISVFRVND
jgi:hypothetical protein